MDGNILTNPHGIAECFNAYLASIGPCVVSKFVMRNCTFETYVKLNPNFLNFSTVNDLYLLSELSSNKASWIGS